MSSIIHFLIRDFFKKRGFVDSPDGIKKKHKNDIPLSGGLSFAVSFTIFSLFSFAVFYFNLGGFFSFNLLEVVLVSNGYPYVFLGWLIFLSIVLLAICLIDDLVNLPVWVRLFAQISCTILMIQLGNMNIINLGSLFGGQDIVLHEYLGFLFTVFCVVGIINAFNWIDGLDGLFSFQVFIAVMGLSILVGNITFASIAFIAALLPYSMMNLGFLGSRSKVFIGDHGAMTIGFILACNLIFVSQNSFVDVRPVDALWCVGLVLLNAIRVMWLRFKRKVSIFNSDREHIHHYFLDQGYSDKTALLIVCSIGLSISGFGWILYFLDFPEWFSLVMFLSILFLWSFIGKFANQFMVSPKESLQSSK